MSTVTTSSRKEHRVTVPALLNAKRKGHRITMLTAYEYSFARCFDRAGVDALLVGDSLGNVVQGCDSTLHVTLDEVIYHTRSVVRAASRALVVSDMPFGAYQVSPEDATRSAIRLVKEGGAQAVKLEGGRRMIDTIERISLAEIPVMGHVGLTPQSIHTMGGYRVQGRGKEDRTRVLNDALAVQKAGGFAVVLEGIPADLAMEITGALEIPTIGIGAGVHCDGQVLVMHDMLGLSDWSPGFVKQYESLGSRAVQAARSYIEDVENQKFPGEEHTYK